MCYVMFDIGQELFPGELVTTLYKASWYTAKVRRLRSTVRSTVLQSTCNALGGHLAEINSAAEQSFVQRIKTASKS